LVKGKGKINYFPCHFYMSRTSMGKITYLIHVKTSSMWSTYGKPLTCH
jgi:hypothetical protein